MFVKKATADEFFTEVTENLNKLQSKDEARYLAYTNKITNYLKKASEILKNAGLNEEAEIVNDVQNNTDPALAGSDTIEKQEKNLKEYGTPLFVYNNDDEVIIESD
jgi:hypothetical protein